MRSRSAQDGADGPAGAAPTLLSAPTLNVARQASDGPTALTAARHAGSGPTALTVARQISDGPAALTVARHAGGGPTGLTATAEPAAATAPAATSEPAATTGPAVVTVQTVTTAPAATTEASAPVGHAPAAGPLGGADIEELLKKLFDPLLRRLKAELRIDRERRGSLTDLRR
jgi:hypothetical protein